MSLDRLYLNTVVTVDDVEAQIRPIIKTPVDQRYSIFYQRNISSAGFSQGDIINFPPICAKGLDSETGLVTDHRTGYGIIVSNSCDTESGREEFISILPLMPLASPDSIEFSSTQERNRYVSLFRDITNYNNTTYFYVPPAPAVGHLPAWEGMYGAFQQIQPYGSEELHRQLKQNGNMILASLQMRAYYLFLLKLTVHFLRPDDRFPVSHLIYQSQSEAESERKADIALHASDFKVGRALTWLKSVFGK